MDEALTIEARHERGYPVVTVAGEIDIATATRLREELRSRRRPPAGGRPGPGPASSIWPGFPHWSARPGPAPPRTAAACTWSAPGRGSTSCSG